MTGEAWVVELEIARIRTPRPAANLVLAAPDLLSGTSPFTQSPPSVAEPPPPSAPPRLIFAVTAHHEHYGSVSVYAQDVSFCSFAWPKGEACGTKTTAITQATLMAATSFPMPPLMSQRKGYAGFTESKFLRAPCAALEPALQQLCQRHSDALAALERKCNTHVAKAADRPFPFNYGLWCFNPRWMEASVSV